MTSLASSSVSLNGKWSILTELTDAALLDVSALPAALDAIISSIVLEKPLGIVIAVAAACAEQLSHLMRATFYSEITAHRLLPGISFNRLPPVRLGTLRCLAAISQGLERGATGGLPCPVLKRVETVLTAEGTSQEERSMALLACIRSWGIHSLAMIIKTYGESEKITTLKTESDWNDRLENHPWGALLLLLHRHFPSSTAVVAMREILCIAEDEHMATGFVDQNTSSGIDPDPFVVVQDGIDTMPTVNLRLLQLLHPLLIGPDLSLRAMARDLCSAGLVRNPEECSQGLIGILISPDCCSESTKTILYLFSEAPLFKIDNHELIVRIATIIQEIICGLKNAALKDSNEEIAATTTSTSSSNVYMLEVAIMATLNCINVLSHFHSEEKKIIELSWMILREVESMSRNEDNSNSSTICTANEGEVWNENTSKVILERLARVSTLSAQCMLSAIVMSRSPTEVVKVEQQQQQHAKMEDRSSSSHIFNPRFYLSNVSFCAALSRAALSAVELSNHPNREEEDKKMAEKEEKMIEFPLPITAELLKSLPLTSSPNHHRTSIVGSDDLKVVFDDDHTTASAAMCSMGNVVTLFRLHSGTFVGQRELSKALMNGRVVHAFEQWGGWKLYELAREAMLHGFYDVALCCLRRLEKLIQKSNSLMVVSEPWVKMLRCLAEAEVKGGVVTRDLEQPCIYKDTGNTTTWTTATGEGGAAAERRSVTDCLLESIEWLLITRNVCGGADGEDAFAFQKEFLTARMKLFEGIRLLSMIRKDTSQFPNELLSVFEKLSWKFRRLYLWCMGRGQSSRKIACRRLLVERNEGSSGALSTKEKLWLETLSRQSTPGVVQWPLHRALRMLVHDLLESDKLNTNHFVSFFARAMDIICVTPFPIPRGFFSKLPRPQLNAQVVSMPYPFSISSDYFKKIPSDVLSCVTEMRCYVKMGLKNGHNRTTEVLGGFKRNEIKHDKHDGGGATTTTSICVENKKGCFIARCLFPPEWLHDIQGNHTQFRLWAIINGGTGETWIVPYHLSVQVEIDDSDE